MPNSDIEKWILMAAPDNNFIVGIFPNDLFSKKAAKIYLLRSSKLNIFNISYHDVRLKREEFLWILGR